MSTVFLTICIAMVVLIVGCVFSQPIAKAVRRRLAGFSYEGDVFLPAGLRALAACVPGLAVMCVQ